MGLCDSKCPVPSGPYSVGCTDIMTPGKPEDGAVFFRLFYPSETHSKEYVSCPQFTAAPEFSARLGEGFLTEGQKDSKWRKAIGRHLFSYAFGEDIPLPIRWHANVLEKEEKFPILIFSHGLGGNRQGYAGICSELASYGFAVAAIEHREGSSVFTFYCEASKNDPNDWDCTEVPFGGFDIANMTRTHFEYRNEQAKKRAKESKAVVDLLSDLNSHGHLFKNCMDRNAFKMDQLKDKLDLTNVAIAGQSFGGATVFQALNDFPETFKCGAALETWFFPIEPEVLRTEIKRPAIVIMGPHAPDLQQAETQIHRFITGKELEESGLMLDQRDPRTKRLITVRHMSHMHQTDFAFLLRRRWMRWLSRFDGAKMNVLQCHEINRRLILAFFDLHLGNLNLSTESVDDVVSAFKDQLVDGGWDHMPKVKKQYT